MTLRHLAFISALWITTWIQPVVSSSFYAFWTDHAIQIGLQDLSTGEIHHSNCNSEKIPIFPIDEPNVLETRQKPRNGTSIAAAGWWDSQKVVASIFWQGEDGAIVNGFYECNMTTGKFNRQGEYLISKTAAVDSIHDKTGLAVELLGATDGYRVFYHNNESQVMMMSYNTVMDWKSAGTVSQDPQAGMVLSSAHYGKENISVIFAQGDKDVEVAQLADDRKWHLETFPRRLEGKPTNQTESFDIQIDTSSKFNFTLPAWDSKTKAITMAVDRAQSRNIFYIGTDSKLHQVDEGKDGWELASNQSATEWPVADEPSSDLAMAYRQSEGEIWLYYRANETIVEAYRGYYGNWSEAQALPQAPAKSEDPPVNGTSIGGDGKDGNNETPKEDKPQSDSGLSTGAKAGIGAGVGVGALLLVGLLFCLCRRRRNTRPSATNDRPISEVDGSTVYPPNPQFYSPPQYAVKEFDKTEPTEMPSPPPPVEMDHHQPASFLYELPAGHR